MNARFGIIVLTVMACPLGVAIANEAPHGAAESSSAISRAVTPTPTPTPEPSVIINELDTDTPGAADDLEFIELYNRDTVAPIDLDGYVLVLYNGNGDEAYSVIDLGGLAIAPGGFALIGSAGVSPVPDIVLPDGSLQEGSDAVALFAQTSPSAFVAPFDSALSLPPGALLVDAVVYGTNDPEDLELLALLKSGQPQVDESGGAGGSAADAIARFPDGAGGLRTTTGFVAQAPTPGASNAGISTPTPTPTPTPTATPTPVSQLIFYEPFDMDAGPLTLEASEWTTDAGSPGEYNILDFGSLYGEALFAPIGNRVEHSGLETEDVGRSFPAVTPEAGAEKSVYVSLLVAPMIAPESPVYFAHFLQGGAGGEFRGRLHMRSDGAGGVQFGVSFSEADGGGNYAAATFPLVQTHLLVLKLTMDPAGPDCASLYIDPAPGQAESAAPAAADFASGDDIDGTGVGRFSLRQSAAFGRAQIDEIRIGESFESVTPARPSPRRARAGNSWTLYP